MNKIDKVFYLLHQASRPKMMLYMLLMVLLTTSLLDAWLWPNKLFSVCLGILWLFLLPHFLGFIFLSVIGIKSQQEKPLAPYFSKKVYHTGFLLIFPLSVLSILFLLCSTRLNEPQKPFFQLCFFVFLVLPLWMKSIADYPQITFKNFFSFFRKKATDLFAYVFWIGAILLITLQIYTILIALQNKLANNFISSFFFTTLVVSLICYTLNLLLLLSGVFSTSHQETTLPDKKDLQ